MRKLLVVLSLVTFALVSTPGVQAAGSVAPHPSMAASMTKMPSTKAQIALVKSAHAKASQDHAYLAALMRGDTAAAQKMLVADGAPANVVVKINNTTKPGSKARARITITVSCCPLTITVSIK